MRLRADILPQQTLSFYNHKTGSLQPDIVEELRNGLWRDYVIDNHLYNDEIGEMRITEWRSLFPHITPVMPGFRYNTETGEMEEKRFVPRQYEMTLSCGSLRRRTARLLAYCMWAK